MTQTRTFSAIAGVLFVAVLAAIATMLSQLSWFKHLSLSPLIIGILLGMLCANTFGHHLPETWRAGLKFCSKRLLRLGIIFFGFRLTLKDVTQVGTDALAIDLIMVSGTIGLGLLLGRWLKMDKETTLLTSVGSGICGAAAVLGAEATLRSDAYKTAVAVSTVVLFGTLSMFVYPVLYGQGVFALSPREMGLFTGSSVHEVAHVVGAANAMGKAVADVAIIVKMIRVILLVPVLLLISVGLRKTTIASVASATAVSASGEQALSRETTDGAHCDEVATPKPTAQRINIPWFAFLFLAVIALNSVLALPKEVIDSIKTIDTFALTMAMTALGCETSIDKFRQAGWRPFVLALLLYVWLVVGGYFVVKLVA